MTKEEKLLQHFQNRCAQIISSGLDNKLPETD
ncbi:MAG: hypothetical protein RIT30_1285, partial [Bacteroidota bacterium]